VGFTALAALGGDTRLIVSDFAAAMVEAARRQGAALGFERVEYSVLDAEALELSDESVDGVLCLWGTCCSRTRHKRSLRRNGCFGMAGTSLAPSLPDRRRTRGQRYRCRCSWSLVIYRRPRQDNRGSLRSPTPLG
jgi:hypothetical protein